MTREGQAEPKDLKDECNFIVLASFFNSLSHRQRQKFNDDYQSFSAELDDDDTFFLSLTTLRAEEALQDLLTEELTRRYAGQTLRRENES